MDGKSNRDLISRHGIKYTRQRSLTLDILARAITPLSAEMIYLQMRDADSTISLSTVYRVLDAFIEKGLVTKALDLESDRAAFALKSNEHRHNLTCTRCRRTVVIDNCPLGSLVDALEKTTSFFITSHRLEMYGLCTFCKDQNTEKGSKTTQ